MYTNSKGDERTQLFCYGRSKFESGCEMRLYFGGTVTNEDSLETTAHTVFRATMSMQ